MLSELQDRLPPFPTDEAMAVIELELGVPATQVFSFLSANPVAAASFGQVGKLKQNCLFRSPAACDVANPCDGVGRP